MSEYLPSTEYEEYDEELEDILEEDIEEERQPSLTWKLNPETGSVEGLIDGKEALEQALYMLLRTELGDWAIFENYGRELNDLFGLDPDYVVVEGEARIREAILSDDRFEEIADITLENRGHGSIYITCTAIAATGETATATAEIELTGEE